MVSNMVKGYDLKQKEVINIDTAERLGYVYDVDVDLATGLIRSVIIPRVHGIFRLFSKEQDYRIPWENIAVIGEEIILVRNPESCKKISIKP